MEFRLLYVIIKVLYMELRFMKVLLRRSLGLEHEDTLR